MANNHSDWLRWDATNEDSVSHMYSEDSYVNLGKNLEDKIPQTYLFYSKCSLKP